MNVTIEYKGAFASKTKIKEEVVEFDGESLRQLIDALAEKHGAPFKDGLLSPAGELKISVLVNSEAAALDTVLKDGDSVTFIQYMYGG